MGDKGKKDKGDKPTPAEVIRTTLFLAIIGGVIWVLRGDSLQQFIVFGEDVGAWWAQPLKTALKHLSLRSYWAPFDGFCNRFPYLGSWLEYLPVGFLVALVVSAACMAVVDALSKEEKPNYLEDPDAEIIHGGIDSPAAEHFDDWLAVCPEINRNFLKREFWLHQVSLVTPGQRKAKLKDRLPSEADKD